jgi:hypothetical protein
MTRNIVNLLVAAAAAMWVLAASALAQTSSPMTINVPQLNEAEFQRWVGKSNAYVELLNDSTRALDSLRRYASWVDMKLGPTGKERYISYGLYSVDPAGAERVIAKARAAADAPPPIPPLDEAARAYATSFETLMPLLNAAAGYYDRKDYTDDQMARGKALHAQIVPAMNAFYASRQRLEDGQEQLSAGLARQELALIEAREGKSKRWHLRHIAIAAKATIDTMPHDRNATDMTEFSRAIVALSDAVRDYEEASKTFGGDDAGNARDLLAELRTLREKIQQKSADSSDFRNVINFYNGVVQWINNTLPYAASRP